MQKKVPNVKHIVLKTYQRAIECTQLLLKLAIGYSSDRVLKLAAKFDINAEHCEASFVGHTELAIVRILAVEVAVCYK